MLGDVKIFQLKRKVEYKQVRLRIIFNSTFKHFKICAFSLFLWFEGRNIIPRKTTWVMHISHWLLIFDQETVWSRDLYMWPAACYCKWSSIETIMSIHLHTVLLLAAYNSVKNLGQGPYGLQSLKYFMMKKQ